MAQYKDRDHVTLSTDPLLFETQHAQGTRPQNPGIYRCTGCGDEAVVPRGGTLPVKPHRGKWKLLVLAEQYNRAP
jgi:hypothetical protein